MTLYMLDDITPKVSETSWVAPDAQIIGNVVLKDHSSIWFSAVLRGDNERITVGQGTNIQEHSLLHTDMGFPLVIGENCTIGHGAILHGCSIKENSLIGMGATILNGAIIGKNCLIGAGAMITEGKEIPDGSLVIGSPGKVVRQLDEAQINALKLSALHYQENAQRFKAGLKPI